MENNVVVIGVPEVAEFHKFWLVEETNKFTFSYVASYFTKNEAIEALKHLNNDNIKLLSNENWAHGRVLINE